MPDRPLSRLALAVMLPLVAAAAVAEIPVPTSFEWIGAAELPRGATFEGIPVGGLSSLSFDPASGEFLAMSDDRSVHGPARVMRLRIDLATGRLPPDGVSVVGQLPLADRLGRPFPPRSLDPEGFALTPDALFVGSEGEAKVGLAPFVAEFDRAGRWRRDLPLRSRFLPDGRGTRGVRENLGFESLARSPDGRFLFGATESALSQDGPQADFGVGASARLLRWDLGAPEAPPEEFVLAIEPIRGAPPGAGAFRVNGLVDLLALSSSRLLALERQYVEGVGVEARLFLVDLAAAAPVTDFDRLPEPPPRSAGKLLLLDFGGLGVRLDNLEGIAFGPQLPDGRRSLVVVSDDNFAPAEQVTQVLAFAVDFTPVTIAEVQGPGHHSPFAGRWVTGVEGTVTALVDRPRDRGFWFESVRPDDDRRTSEGLFVAAADVGGVEVGAALRVGGRVLERVPGRNQLSVTTLELAALERAPAGEPLPAPPLLWYELEIPRQVDDDALALFEPDEDAIDFWESLEGMRLTLPDSVVAGATRSFGEIVVLPEGVPSTGTSAAGGALARRDGGGPLDRAFVSGRLAGSMPRAAVGDRVAGPLTGVVDYAFSNYRLLPLVPPEVLPSGAPCSRPARSENEPGRFAIASYNVYNLSATDDEVRFERLAARIVRGLGAPELVALQEVQDDSGARGGDGVVSAQGTLAKLVAAIERAGGPRYEAVQIDPEPDREGGQPGGNIRVALLLDPAHVRFTPRGQPDALTAARFDTDGQLEANPSRLAPASAAFAPAGVDGEGVRRSLVVEVEVSTGRRFLRRWQPLVVVVNHWSSKYEDDRAFGAIQPPGRPTAARRFAQAREVRAFAISRLAVDPEARLVVIGDFNDVAGSEPMREIGRPPLENLVLRLPPEERYTFSFEGGSAAIDHLLVSPPLARGARIEAVHLDSDCPDAERASDHDPLLARLPRR
ncbi:MAG: esterase-like activity of phytase family protein [Thermoanaerobaculia bacterium]|nr:esterase-like activity of phytase family protein [Thermoanaerobaculia bacterium]